MDFNSAFDTSMAITQMNNAWSAEQAQKQMDFQERLSNTAHQREVADLKAAGLNPALSAHSNGASTPSGAMGATDTSTFASLFPKLLEISESAVRASSNSANAVQKLVDGYYRKYEFTDIHGDKMSETNFRTGNYTLGRTMIQSASEMKKTGYTSILGLKVPNTVVSKVYDEIGHYLVAHENEVPNVGTSAYKSYLKYRNEHGFSTTYEDENGHKFGYSHGYY